MTSVIGPLGGRPSELASCSAPKGASPDEAEVVSGAG